MAGCGLHSQERAVQLVPSLTSFNSPEDLPARHVRFDDLLQRYGAFLHRLILRMCPAELRSSSDDIEQEAKIALWKALDAERNIDFPASYIHRVALTTTLRAIRRARARREEPIDLHGSEAEEAAPRRALHTPAEASPHGQAERAELTAKIEMALGQLRDNRRAAVTLHLRDLTTREIGDLLGWSEPKARNLLYRGLNDLRKALHALGIEYQP